MKNVIGQIITVEKYCQSKYYSWLLRILILNILSYFCVNSLHVCLFVLCPFLIFACSGQMCGTLVKNRGIYNDLELFISKTHYYGSSFCLSQKGKKLLIRNGNVFFHPFFSNLDLHWTGFFLSWNNFRLWYFDRVIFSVS